MTQSALDPISSILAPGEELRGHAPLVEGTVAVTNERLFVANGANIAVDITWARLRRVQLDIERHRPATLVVVPEWPTDPPQVLSVPPASYRSVTNLVAVIAERLAAESSTGALDIPADRPVHQPG
jgi:hypothetical protein